MTGDGSSYHGYWQQDLYRLNSNFGTADDLKALSTALHSRGMYLMVDIVGITFTLHISTILMLHLGCQPQRLRWNS